MRLTHGGRRREQRTLHRGLLSPTPTLARLHSLLGRLIIVHGRREVDVLMPFLGGPVLGSALSGELRGVGVLVNHGA